MTIPRLELIAAHMATNLAANIREALPSQNIRSVTCWTDSTVVLQSLNDKGHYKVFVANRVSKILERKFIAWNYIPTKQNPADTGSRGSPVRKLPEIWWTGPTWLKEFPNKPAQPDIGPTAESQQECKIISELMAATKEALDMFDNFLAKYEFWKFLRITSWIFRFLNNCRKTKQSGPLTTSEIEQRKKFWIKREQQPVQHSEKFKINEKRLVLWQHSEGIYVCKGRIEGTYPIYLPNKSLLSEKIIFAAHKNTLHGGVLMTMTNVRSAIWIPSLRQLTKSIIRNCYGCKRHYTVPYPQPKPGALPDRSEAAMPLQVIGTDYAGPIYYHTKSKKESKAYILFFHVV